MYLDFYYFIKISSEHRESKSLAVTAVMLMRLVFLNLKVFRTDAHKITPRVLPSNLNSTFSSEMITDHPLKSFPLCFTMSKRIHPSKDLGNGNQVEIIRRKLEDWRKKKKGLETIK